MNYAPWRPIDSSVTLDQIIARLRVDSPSYLRSELIADLETIRSKMHSFSTGLRPLGHSPSETDSSAKDWKRY